MLQPTKSQYGQPTRMCHTTLSDSAISVNPKSTKVNAVPVNAKTTAAKVNAARSKSTSNLNFCANKCGLQKSDSLKEFRVILTMH